MRRSKRAEFKDQTLRLFCVRVNFKVLAEYIKNIKSECSIYICFDNKLKSFLMMNQITVDFLQETIRDFEKGGYNNEDFLTKAHKVYNSTVRNNPGSYFLHLPYPYLYGIVFSYFAKYYSNNVDYYTNIVEDALCCFGRVMTESDSKSERQCAAIRYLLLIDDNISIVKGILRSFREKYSQEIYGEPAMTINMLAQGMEPWAYETDLLVNLGQHCLNESSDEQQVSSISYEEMQRFERIAKSDTYHVDWPMVQIQPNQLFSLFNNFIQKVVQTPYERRVIKLGYKFTSFADLFD